jgi:hypothetical protein
MGLTCRQAGESIGQNRNKSRAFIFVFFIRSSRRGFSAHIECQNDSKRGLEAQNGLKQSRPGYKPFSPAKCLLFKSVLRMLFSIGFHFNFARAWPLFYTPPAFCPTRSSTDQKMICATGFY